VLKTVTLFCDPTLVRISTGYNLDAPNVGDLGPESAAVLPQGCATERVKGPRR